VAPREDEFLLFRGLPFGPYALHRRRTRVLQSNIHARVPCVMCGCRLTRLSSSCTRSATFCLLAVQPAAFTHACIYKPLHLAILWPHIYYSQVQGTRHCCGPLGPRTLSHQCAVVILAEQTRSVILSVPQA